LRYTNSLTELNWLTMTVMLIYVMLQNTPESLDKALSVLKDLDKPPLRAVALTAMLALTQVCHLHHGWSVH